MRRISRIERPLGLLKKQKSIRTPSPYFCSVCKHQTNLFSTSPIQAIPADEKIPFTEKVRQKIWGTDQPPGLDDPYGGTSIFDKTKRPRNQEPPEEVEEMEGSVDNYTQQYYKPATTWEGLLWIGGGMVWQPGDKFEGFLPENEVKGQERIVTALHRAVVEIFSLQQAGKSLREVSTHFPESNPFLDWTDDVQITPSPGGATVHMPEHISLQQAMNSFAAPEMSEEMNEFEPTESQEDVDADRSEVDPMKLGVTPSTEPTVEPAEQIKPEKKAVLQGREPRLELEVKTYEEVISSWDPSWLEISLEDPEVKFAVLKRTMQLTGIRIPDAAIKSSNSVRALLNIIVTPPKPRKLAQALLENNDLLKLENVTVYPVRRRFSAKERDIGRLKVIKKELKARGLDM